MDKESLIIQKTAAYQVAQMQLKGDPENIQLQDAAKAAEAELKALTKEDGVDEAKAKADADAKAKADADAKAKADADAKAKSDADAKAKADADAKAKADAGAKAKADAETDQDGETQNPDNQAQKAKKK